MILPLSCKSVRNVGNQIGKAVEAKVIISAECVAIRLSGRFDVQGQPDFLEAVEAAVVADTREIQLDFGAVDYIDSTALGLLLVLRDQARRAGKTVSLVNVQGSVKHILDIANFAKLFAMS